MQGIRVLIITENFPNIYQSYIVNCIENIFAHGGDWTAPLELDKMC